MEEPVLIVGAGPVGLVTACELLLQDVPVRIIDAERAPTPHSRANVIWPRQLELLRRIGVSRTLIERGHRLDGVTFYSNRRKLGSTWLNKLDTTPYPFALMISQNETESVLRERLAELGGRVEAGVRLVGLDNGGPSPVVKLEHPDGSVSESSARWLIGADGAHSVVRKQLDIGFDHEPISVSVALADAKITGGLPEDQSLWCYSPEGAVVLSPLGDSVFRLAVTVPPSDDGAAPTRELFQELVDQRTPGKNTVEDLKWATTFQVRCRIASTFRAGRCFLVGDAAHVVSPSGGQGMNTGFQDAVNLGWKLGGVERGVLDERVLDSYDAERREAANRVAASTSATTRFALADTGFKRAVRDTKLRARWMTGRLQREMAPQLSQVNVQYGPPPATPAEKDEARRGVVSAGGRMPVLIATPDDGFPGWPVISRDSVTALLWPGRTVPADWPGVADRIRAALPAGVEVLELAPGVAAPLARALGDNASVAVVRPDGHLLVKVAPDRVEAVLPELRQAGLLPA